MNVLLVNPPVNSEHLFATPPLGLMYLASALRVNGHNAKIIDLYSFGGELTPGDVKGIDVVGITGMSFQHNSILKTAKIAKEVDNSKTVIVGGPHATALPTLLLKDEHVDFVFRGEGEVQFPLFLDTDDWTNIQGFCFEGHTVPPVIVRNIDSLSLPAWDLIDNNKYMGCHHGFFYEKEPIGLILTSRGCPYSCTFCASHCISGKLWRPHSISRVLQEIDYLVEREGIRELQVEDDNFSVNLTRAKEVFKGIIKRDYDLSISFPNGIRLDRLDDGLLELMKKAGVYSLSFGIESGSQRILNRMKKRLKLDFIEKQLRKVKSYGFYTHGFFMVGFPYETKEDIEETIDFALKLDLDAAFFGTYVPLPGSEDFMDLEVRGKINVGAMDWDSLYSVKAVDTSFHLTPDEIKQFQSLATRRFYLRPRILSESLTRIRSMSHVKALLSRIRKM